MERGLQLPRRFHPDLRKYGRSCITDDTVNDLLQFNCYEAHIPYTMQFFKDYNLAGMAYIHIRKGRILSKTSRPYSANIQFQPPSTAHMPFTNSPIARAFRRPPLAKKLF